MNPPGRLSATPPLLHRVPLLDQRLGAVGAGRSQTRCRGQLRRCRLGPGGGPDPPCPGGGVMGVPGGGGDNRARCRLVDPKGPRPRREGDAPQGQRTALRPPSHPWAVPTATWVRELWAAKVSGDRHVPGLLSTPWVQVTRSVRSSNQGCPAGDRAPPAGGRRQDLLHRRGLPAGCG